MRSLLRLTSWAAVALVLALAAGFAPAQPVNNQDEIVYIDAAEFVLRGSAARGGPTDQGSAGGSAEGNDGILTIFRSSEKQDVQNYVTEMVELKHAAGVEVAEYVDEALALEGGVSKALEYNDPRSGKTRHFLQVVTTKAQMPSILKLISVLDLPEMVESSSNPDFEIRMRYRRASEVGSILDALGVGEIVADDLTNTLHFEDSRSKLSLVDFYDVPPLQIEFEVTIMEVSEKNASKLGVDWDSWKRNFGLEAQYYGNNLEAVSANNRLDWLLSLQGPALADFLGYSAQRGNVDIQQRIKVNANNLAPAIISHTRTVPIFGYINTTDDSGGVTKETDHVAAPDSVVGISPARSRFEKVRLAEDEEGLIISILPVIGTELVTAEISIAARSVAAFDELDQPLFAEQAFDTAITLENLQELHVATLERTVATKVRRGIPGLRAIPGLRYLFSVESEQSENSKIFIILKPCYCDTVAYEARINGGPGSILKFKDNKPPAYFSREGQGVKPAASAE